MKPFWRRILPKPLEPLKFQLSYGVRDGFFTKIYKGTYSVKFPHRYGTPETDELIILIEKMRQDGVALTLDEKFTIMNTLKYHLDQTRPSSSVS